MTPAAEKVNPDKVSKTYLPLFSPKEQSASLFFQPKLSIGPVDDVYEREADAMADKVMRMTDHEDMGHPFFRPSESSLQCMCAECEEEQQNVQRKTLNSREPAPATNDQLKGYVDRLNDGGQPLPDEVRNFYEPRFGRDFSPVKVPTDTVAAKSAQSINTLAYTTGNNIVFNSGQYSPATESGKKLLGHELTHVLQPGNMIRRAASDYKVPDLPSGASGDADKIYFNYGGTTIPGTERSKIVALASPPGRNLTLHGFASEEGSASSRLVTVNGRLDAVANALIANGHSTTARRDKVTHPNAGVGDIDYRHRRSVQVLPTPVGLLTAPTTVDPCNLPGSDLATGTALLACKVSFFTSFPTALAIADAAERDVVTTPTAAAGALVSTFFSGVPRADINANIRAIAAQVRQLPTRHVCHTSCDGGCGRPAYNSGRGLGMSGAMVTLCPNFVTAPLDFRINTLIHESAHGNPLEAINDIAYSNTRLIRFLLPADSRRNTDSYVLLMRLVHTPGSMAVGPATPDVLAGMTAVGPGSDTEQTERAVAWLESWLNYGDFDTEILYNTINDSLSAGAWITTGTHEFNIETMHRLATVFTPDLVDPGADGSPRSTPPSERDKINLAAIHDRYDQMYDVVNQNPITVTRGAVEGWGSLVAMPRLTRSVTVNSSFFGLTSVNQVRHLVRLMVNSRSDISSGFKSKYVTALDLIHTHRGLGP